MKCENCNKTEPLGKILEERSNKSDWNDYLCYDIYNNGTLKRTEFEEEFYCFNCFPHLKDVYVENMSKYNEGTDRY